MINIDCGIYRITCLANHRIYFGSSCQLERRLYVHRGIPTPSAQGVVVSPTFGTGGTEAVTVTRSWYGLEGGVTAVRHSVGNGQTSTDIAVTAGVKF